MPRPPFRSELIAAESILVVSVDWTGRTFRFSERPAEAIDANGEVVQLDGGLPTLTDATTLSLFSDEPTRRTFSTSLIFPVDIAELESRGHDLASATAEVARWIVGTAWEDRELLIARGAVTFPEYGEEGEPCALTIEQSPFDDAALIPEATAIVDTRSWPSAHESALGAPYPVVLGQPGYYLDSEGAARVCLGSPALIVEWGIPTPPAGTPITPDASGAVTRLLINAYPTSATQVYVIDPDGAVEANTVETTTDGRGRLVATIDMQTTGLNKHSSGSWWVSWYRGGATKLADGTAIEDAGQILEYLLKRSTLQIDAGRLKIAADLLQPFKAGLYIDEAVSPWEIVRRRLLSWLPVSMRNSTRGLYPLVWNWLATVEDAVATINADEAGTVRVGPVKRTLHPREVISEVRVEYAKDGESSTRAALVLTGEPELPAGVYTSQHAAHAYRLYGLRSTVISAPEVHDRPTAMRLAQIEIRTRGSVPREVTYEVPPSEDWLRVGDVVLIQDDALDYEDQLALIVGRKRTADALSFTLSLIRDPALSRFNVQ